MSIVCDNTGWIELLSFAGTMAVHWGGTACCEFVSSC